MKVENSLAFIGPRQPDTLEGRRALGLASLLPVATILNRSRKALAEIATAS